MSEWLSVLKCNPIEWLLESNNPSVRFFTLKDLLDYADDDPEVLKARNAIMDDRRVSKILSKQKQEGHWEFPEKPYLPKYKSSYWQIMILGMLGVNESNVQIQRAINHIFRFQHADGGFTELSEIGAREEYKFVVQRSLEKDREPPPFDTWAESKIRESELTCLTGNVILALIRLGHADDERVLRALKWLIEVQNVDGGWLCPYWKAHIKDKHGCFMGTITPLHAFSEFPPKNRIPGMESSIRRGAEFLLMHRLFMADHHDFKVIKESWLRFGFPQFFYDILRGLSVVTELGYATDSRIDDALEILLRRQNNDGSWNLESSPVGRMQTTLGRKGTPSKWITFDALRVVRRVCEARGSLSIDELELVHR
jgi:hypothetical protein